MIKLNVVFVLFFSDFESLQLISECDIINLQRSLNFFLCRILNIIYYNLLMMRTFMNGQKWTVPKKEKKSKQKIHHYSKSKSKKEKDFFNTCYKKKMPAVKRQKKQVDFPSFMKEQLQLQVIKGKKIQLAQRKLPLLGDDRRSFMTRQISRDDKTNKNESSQKSKQSVLSVSLSKRYNSLSSFYEKMEDNKLKIERGQLDEAEKGFRKILNINPNKNLEPRYYLGMITKAKNERCLKIPRINKNQMNDYTVLIQACYELEQYDKAIQYCEKELAKGENEKIYITKGKCHFKQKNYGPALNSFIRASKIQAQNPQIFEYMGDCNKNLEITQSAIENYTKCLHLLHYDEKGILLKMLECAKKDGDVKLQKDLRQRINSSYRHHSIPSLKPYSVKEQKTQTNSRLSKEEENLEEICRINFIQAQEQFTKKKFNDAISIIDDLIENRGQKSFESYQFRAKCHYQNQDYEQCESDINQAIKFYENPSSLLTLHLKSNYEIKNLFMMKQFMDKLKEMNANSLTYSEDEKIVNRRKRCLKQALNVFQNGEKNGSVLQNMLSQIPEESSIYNSSIYDCETTVFGLRNIRKVLQNWAYHKFSLSSIEATTDLAFKMVKNNLKDFSILPFHIIYSFFQSSQKNHNFQTLNEKISNILKEMCKKYPPSEKSISESSLRRFNLPWEPRQKINLFPPNKFCSSFRQLHSSIEQLANIAQKEKANMNRIGKKLCQQQDGFKFKSCLKIEKDIFEENNFIEERVLCRIVQKILSEDIKKWKNEFFKDIQFKPNMRIEEYFSIVSDLWQKTIDLILKKKKELNQPITFYVYDLIRAKCLFHNVSDIERTCHRFIELDRQKKIYIVEIENRLSFKTKDVVIKYRINKIIGELQLALQFQSIQNQFNHGLYELSRSQFGPFFASFMWFTGFGLKKEQLFYQQKLKWSLNGLQHLRKFIFEERLKIKFSDFESVGYLYIKNFQIKSNQILCEFEQTRKNQISSSVHKDVKFILKSVEKTFVHESNIFVTIRIENTNEYLYISNDQIQIKNIASSFKADTEEKIQIQFLSERSDYTVEIKQCKRLQKEVTDHLYIK